MDLGFDIQEKLEELGKVPRNIRLGIVVGIFAAVGAGYYLFSYQDSQAKLTRMSAKAQELQRKLNKVKTVANNLGSFESEVAGLERQLTKALKQLPDQRQFEDLLQDISTAGKKTGVEIKSIGRASETRHRFYAEVPFKLVLVGTYHDIAHFFEQVSRLPRIVNIGAMEMQVVKVTAAAAKLKVSGTAKTYRFLGEDETRGKKKNRKKRRRR